MVRMSKYKIKDRVLEKITKLTFEILGKENRKKEFDEVLTDVLSPIERLMIGKRFLVMYMIYKGINFDVIIDVVKVSRATIAKYAFLLDKSAHIKSIFKEISMRDEFAGMMNELVSFVLSPGVPRVNWHNAWKLKKRIQEQKHQGF